MATAISASGSAIAAAPSSRLGTPNSSSEVRGAVAVSELRKSRDGEHERQPDSGDQECESHRVPLSMPTAPTLFGAAPGCQYPATLRRMPRPISSQRACS